MDSKHYNPQKLIDARELRGKTQQEIASELNVDSQTIYRAEAGKNVSIDLLGKMCNYYGMPVTTVILPYPEAVAD